MLSVDLDGWLLSDPLGQSDGRVDDTGLKEDEGDGSDAAAVGLEGSVTPDILSLESAVRPIKSARA